MCTYGSVVKNLPATSWVQEMQEIWIQFLAKEDSLEEEMATHSSILPGKSFFIIIIIIIILLYNIVLVLP